MGDKKKALDVEISIEENVQVSKEGNIFIFKGEKGENKRELFHPAIEITIEGNKILLKPKKSSKRETKLIKTFAAHIKNLMKGVKEGHTYKLKICSGHFPMNVSMSNNQITVKNFIGEKVPRTISITEGVSVKIEGTEILVEGSDKERTGQMAASIEQMTRRPGFDERIFQDGIYLTEKDGKIIKHD